MCSAVYGGGKLNFSQVAADAFGNALGFALAAQSGQTAGNAGLSAQTDELRSAWQDRTYAQNSVTGTMTDVPLRDAGPGAYIGDVYHESRYDAADQIHVLQPTVVTASRDSDAAWSVADADDAEFGRNYGGSQYVVDGARTLNNMKEHAKNIDSSTANPGF